MPTYYLASGSIDNLEVSSSLLVSGTLLVEGSGSNIFVVSGSLGPLLTVSEKTPADSKLFSVNSASIDIFTVNDDKSVRVSGSFIVTGSIVGTVDFANSANVNISAGGVSNNVSQLVFSNANGISFGLNSNTITATVDPTAVALESYYYNIPVFQGSGNTLTLGGSSNLVQPFLLPYAVSAAYLRVLLSNAFGSTTLGTTANTTIAFQQTQTWFANIYTQGTGASSKSLQRLAGSSATMVVRIAHSLGTGTANQTVSYAVTYPVTGSYGNYNTTYNPGASINISTTFLTQFNTNRYLDIPFATTLAAGNYWVAFQRSTATATTAGTQFTGCTHANSFYYATQINSNFAEYGNASNVSTNPILQGNGYWTTNANGSTSVSLALSHISTIASQIQIPFQLINQA